MEVSSELIEHPSEFNLVYDYLLLVLQGFFCILSVLLIAFGSTVNQFLVNIVKKQIEIGYKSEEVNRIAAELRQLKNELSVLSPTAEFATYFRKDREVNKKQEEFDKIKSLHQQTLPSIVKIELFSRGALHLVAVILMWCTAHLTVFCVNSTHFWPFNFMLNLPPFHLFEARQCDPGQTRVSLFFFFSVSLFVYRKYAEKKMKTA